MAPDDEPQLRVPCLHALSALVRHSEQARQLASLGDAKALKSVALLCRAHSKDFAMQLSGVTLLADLAEEPNPNPNPDPNPNPNVYL